MAQNAPSPTPEYLAPLLGVTPHELQDLLTLEHQALRTDLVERKRYAQNLAIFKTKALQQLLHVISSDEKYLDLLRKIIHHDEPRHFYFYTNELDAIERIFAYIDRNDSNTLSFDNLGLYSLPALLVKTRKVKVLNISKNYLTDISLIKQLTDLEVLQADDNQIGDISFLKANTNLRVLSLNMNKVKRNYEVLKSMPSIRSVYLVSNLVNETDVIPILESPYIQDIQLQGNQIYAPAEFLTDISKLRGFYNIKIPWLAQPKAELYSVTQSYVTGNINEPETSFESEPEGSYNKSEEEPVTENEPEIFISHAIRKISLRDSPEKSLLDVEEISDIFYNLINNSDNSDNAEHFFGLFGRWGRGKTYFWNFILNKHLKGKENKKYIPIEFHAWKYQDTPGIWAYLYNTFNEAYLGKKPTFLQLGKWFLYYWKILVLNYKRGKLYLLIGFLFTLGAAIWGYFQVSDTILKDILKFGIPVSAIGMLTYIAKTYKDDTRKIIAALTTNVNFNSQLGFQHEVQQELKHLLKAWLPVTGTKRIFLFIDDIDRCSEDKIIQIVDYIRVLLHDKEIQDRVTVLAAIDERILLHAIQDKYKAFIENKDNDASYRELCREYMDKLFLAGLKLGPLTEFEKEQIVDGFTATDTAPAEALTVSANINSLAVYEEAGLPGQEGMAANGQTEKIQPQANHSPASTPVTFPYENWEREFIKERLARDTESTPRSIRVYMYRYLLGKQLVEKALTEGKASWTQWYNTKSAKQYFALKLLHYGFKSNVDSLMADYRKFIIDYDENNTVPETFYEQNFNLNQELGSIMYQVLTMIVAY